MTKEKYITSIKSVHQELLNALSSNSDDYVWLRNNCNTQGKLASTERKSKHILPMSTNTFKTYADKHISGGFKEINALRKNLYSSQVKTNRTKKDISKENINNLKDELDKATRSRAIMIKAYNELNRITLDAISSNETYQRDYNKHIDIYKGFFGLKIVKDNG